MNLDPDLVRAGRDDRDTLPPATPLADAAAATNRATSTSDSAPHRLSRDTAVATNPAGTRRVTRRALRKAAAAAAAAATEVAVAPRAAEEPSPETAGTDVPGPPHRSRPRRP
ncbi:hypothetical protein [Cellulomonas persica]